VRAELAAGQALSVGELALDGKDVMAILPGATGREVGEALRHLLALVLADPATNERARLSAGLRAWWQVVHPPPGGPAPA
jgi:hypothetical protein